ncbi:MAG: hypothetical protein FJ403_06465 [Verrucomicrobia bacterium]|nr:hypothetical protein [Verrucomicrobiota bacterium]
MKMWKLFLPAIAALVLQQGTALFDCASHAADAKPAPTNPTEMRAVPDGNYLVTLELNGKEQRLNLKVKDSAAQCVNSSDPILKGLRGRFQQYLIRNEIPRNGVFLLFLMNETQRMNQLWIFRNDGSAAIREVPDRGEMQRAIPTDNDSIELPKRMQ